MKRALKGGVGPFRIYRPSARAALLRHTKRFARRLRDHGIYHYSLPVFIASGQSAAKIPVGARIVNVFDDGSCTRSLMRANNSFDNRAFVAQSNRMHAIYLAMAADARRLGMFAQARADLNTAIEERKHHERARAR